MLFETYTTCQPNEKIFRCQPPVLFLQGILKLLVQKPPKTRMPPATSKCFVSYPLEHEFQSELNQPWICPGSRAGYYPEVLIVGGAANRIWRGELRSIGDVEELRSKLEAQPVVGGKLCSLE